MKKHLHIMVEQEHKEKIEALAYFSGKSVSEIIRMAIDKLKEKEFKTKYDK